MEKKEEFLALKRNKWKDLITNIRLLTGILLIPNLFFLQCLLVATLLALFLLLLINSFLTKV